jgi:GH24 family phage-related lysozyme (muramidase)
MLMKTSKAGIALIKSFEGLQLNAYICPAGVPTIGYGHTGKVDGKKIKLGMKITEQKANELLLADIIKFEKNVMRYDKRYHWTQNEFDALVDFAFNIGSINKLTALGTRKKALLSQKILLYNKAGGKVLNGLTIRRHIERIRFLKP